jgi:S1-C subfamily serine protease
VIHLEHFNQHPAVVAGSAPDDGSLVLLVTLDGTRSRLAVWSGPTSASTTNGGTSSATGALSAMGTATASAQSNPVEEAVVVNVDGRVAGLTLRGRYLPIGPYEPIVKQIVDTGGFKRRAALGVSPGQVDGNDPARMGTGALGTRPAVRVLRVNPGTPADHAGIRAGDLILTIGGQPIGLPQALAAVAATSEGPTQLTLIRDGREMTVVATLAISP